MKTMLRFLIAVLIMLAVMASLVQPVLAAGEPPPPGGEPSGKHNSSSDPVHPPSTLPDQVAKAVEAFYQADAVLKDSHGNPVPLASKQAVGLLAGPLATACPPGSMPTWLGGLAIGCHDYPTGTPITSAIGAATTLAHWTVWVETALGPYVEVVTVNKSISVIGENAANTAITGNVTMAAANTTLMQFTINGQVSAAGQSGYVHLQDLIVKNPGAMGIEITGQKGSIVLNNVVSSGNGGGAYLDALSPGKVTVINSVFNDNTSPVDDMASLTIKSAGAVRLENVIVSGNSNGPGVDILSKAGVTVTNAVFSDATSATRGYGLGIWPYSSASKLGAVTMTNVSAANNDGSGVIIFRASSALVNSSSFQSNLYHGLEIVDPGGAVTLNDLYAADNGAAGVYVHMQGNSALTVTNSEFDFNEVSGLYVDAKGGPINLKNNLALENGNDGFTLDAGDTGSSVSISKSVSGMNTGDTGFWINTKGAITLNNVTAFDNVHSGMYLNHCYGNDDTGKCTVTSAITLANSLGLNEFSGNGYNGLLIMTGGKVTLTGLKAMDNGETGVGINYCGANNTDLGDDYCKEYISASNVSITSAEIMGNIRWVVDGLAVETNGTVTLKNVYTHDNLGNGAWLGDVMAPKTVTITASDFSFNGSDGLDVHAAGAINADHLTAFYNYDGSGVYLFSATGAVNLTSKTGSNQFWGNGGTGLFVLAKGAISVKDTVANLNKQGAIRLDNCAMDSGTRLCTNLAASKITLSNVFMDKNHLDAAHNAALSVFSTGAVSLDKVFAYETGGSGAFERWGLQVDNSGVSKGAPAVSITNSEFSYGEYSSGMLVRSLGNITLNHVSSSMNINLPSPAAVFLNNCIGESGKCLGTGNISILNTLGNNAFDVNTDQSLWLVTTGSITLNGVSASYNGHGAILDNTNAGKANPVTITNSQFNQNSMEGLMASSNGVIKLNYVEADGNGITGAFLLNGSLAVVKPGITITNSQFNLNNNGLSVTSQGNIALDNITASDNLSQGVFLDSCMAIGDDPVCTGIGSVSITNKLGDNRIMNNGSTGLSVLSAKNINLTGVTATSNGDGGGADLDTCIWITASSKCLGAGNVSVSLSSFTGNAGNGLSVESSGLITVNKVVASGNGQEGADLANQFTAIATIPVTITSSFFDSNLGSGLEIKTWSNITLNNVSASGNQGDFGARLDTCDSYPTCNGSGSVTILSKLGPNAFNNNHGIGLYIASKGAVTMDRVSVAGNGIVHNTNGAEIWIGTQPSPSAIFISCSIFTGSGQHGLKVVSNGSLTLKGTLVADNNKLGGAGDLSYGGTPNWQRVYCGY